MIGKKVESPNKDASKATRIGGLTRYILAPERRESREHTHGRAQEKCIYAGSRGFVTDTDAGQRAEMIALAQDAVRSRDPINHYVLSYREGELPDARQVEQAVSLLLDELGLSEHQAIYGLHSDTDNVHLHLAVNRVHPDTLKVVKIGGGFDIESLHRALARIEHAQGWQPELRARYRVDDGGKLARATAQTGPRQPDQRKRDMENQTGAKSAQRIAIEQAAPLIANAGSWSELHAALAAKGMRYERAGSGAKVFVGDVPIKASRVARDASFGRLEKRLGEYEPAAGSRELSPAKPQPLRPDLPGWAEYSAARSAHYEAKDDAWVQLRRALAAERKQLSDRQQARRAEVLSGRWRGRGELLNSVRKALAEEQRQEKAALQRQHAEQRLGLRERHRPFPGLEQWHRQQGRTVQAEQWRHRDSAMAPVGIAAAAAPFAPGLLPVALLERYATDLHARRALLQSVLRNQSLQHGREMARLRRSSQRRWALAKRMSSLGLGSKALSTQTRRADQRDRTRQQARHRKAVDDILAADPLPSFADWLQGNALPQAPAPAQPKSRPRAQPHSPLLRDNGHCLTLQAPSSLAVTVEFLRMAKNRYGTRLGVTGSDAFKRALSRAAATVDVELVFVDGQTEALRKHLLRDVRSLSTQSQPARPALSQNKARGRGRRR